MRSLPTVLALTLAALSATFPLARAEAQESEAPPVADDAVEASFELDDERARLHFTAAQELFEAGSFAEAAREFALAYELSRRPEMLVNLARAHERDGARRAAIADLELLIAQHPSSSYRGEAEERLARLRAEQRAVEPPAEPKTVLPAVSAPWAEESAPPARAATSRLAWTARATLATAIGTGVVALATGLRAHDLYRDLDRACPGGLCEDPFEQKRDRGHALARTSTAFTVLSLVAAAAGVVSWALDRRARKRAAELAPAARLIDGGRS